jgi:hypothetical protein
MEKGKGEGERHPLDNKGCFPKQLATAANSKESGTVYSINVCRRSEEQEILSGKKLSESTFFVRSPRTMSLQFLPVWEPPVISIH